MESGWLPALDPGQGRDRGRGQRRQQDTVHRGWGKVSEHGAQRMLGPHLIVTVGDDQHDGEMPQAAPEELDQIERRLIGPVNILDDEDRRRGTPRQVVDCCIEDDVAVGRRLKGGAECLPRLPRHVVERRQGMGREERLAASPEHARGRALAVHELLQERGLADPGLAAHERHASRSTRHALERGGELVQVQLSLE